jgi:hypothetical protein
MITVGAVIGGPECQRFDTQLRRFMRYCRENSQLGSNLAEVNIVYHLPGSIAKPDYTGVRLGRFSKAERTLMVQVGVEDEWIAAKDEEIILKYIHNSADEAIGLAKSELDRRGVPYDIEVDRRFLDSWMSDIISKECDQPSP